MLNGMFLLSKPSGITSRDLVNGVVRHFQEKKVGHTGTLDPFAKGLMLITIGKGTKLGPFLEAFDKSYVATLSFGQQTNTGDLTGEVIATSPIIALYEDYVQETLETFLGTQHQIPPMFSALKKDGVPLYELAREGITVPREPRTITVFGIQLLTLTPTSITFSCDVSKGTYIRTLAEDIAKAFGMVGHLTALTRTRVGRFRLQDAKTLDQLKPSDCVSLTDALVHLPKIVIQTEVTKKAIMDGKLQTFHTEHPMVLCVDQHNNALAIYERVEGQRFRSLRGLF